MNTGREIATATGIATSASPRSNPRPQGVGVESWERSEVDPRSSGESLPDSGRLRKCEECGEEFVSKSGKGRFCRPYCRHKARERGGQWRPRPWASRNW
jgi:hypothetical protein